MCRTAVLADWNITAGVLSTLDVMRAMTPKRFVRAVPGMRADTDAFFGASA